MKNKLYFILILAAFASAAACSDDKNDNKEPECVNNAIQCSEVGVPQICKEQHWVEQAKCAAGLKCVDGSCVSENAPECTGNARQCTKEGVPQVCTDGKWTDQAKCAEGLKCVDGSCVSDNKPECSGSVMQCDEKGIPQKCEKGKWQNLTECKSDEKCVDGSCVNKTAAECVNYSKRCSVDGIPQVCKDGKWDDNGSCDTEEKCLDGNCVDKEQDECPVGEKRCSAEGKIELCAIGKWMSLFACGNDLKCLDGRCVEVVKSECENDQKRCTEGGLPEICENGQWVIKSACSEGYACESGECAEQPVLCRPDDCKKITGEDYQGNICAEDPWFGGETCGCITDKDCNEGYYCNLAVGFCSKGQADVAVDGFKLTIPKTNSCDGFQEVNDLLECSKNNNIYTLKFTTGAVAEIHASSISGGFANLKAPGSDYYIKFTGISTDSVLDVVWQHGSREAVWANNQLMIADNASPVRMNTYTADVQNEDMNISFIPTETATGFTMTGTGSSVVKVHSVHVRFATEDDKLTCMPSKCKYEDSSSYKGNICLYDTCGCNKDSDCNRGFLCGNDHVCYDPCDPSECRKASGDGYKGNVCRIDPDNVRGCGCDSIYSLLYGQDICKDGYTCAPSLNYTCASIEPREFTIDFTKGYKTCKDYEALGIVRECREQEGLNGPYVDLVIKNGWEINGLDSYYVGGGKKPGYFISPLDGSVLMLTMKRRRDDDARMHHRFEVKWHVEGIEGTLTSKLELISDRGNPKIYETDGWDITMTSVIEDSSENFLIIQSDDMSSREIPLLSQLYVESITVKLLDTDEK